MRQSLICVSQGDINGIGIELFIKGCNIENIKNQCVLISNKETFQEYCSKNYIDLKDNEINFIKDISDFNKNKINIMDIINYSPVETGNITKRSGKVSFESVEKGYALCKKGIFSGIVTLPICKEAWYKNNIKYPGHTEFFGEMEKKDFIMIMYSPDFTVSLVTIHEPLDKVSSLLTENKILKTIELTGDFSIRVYGEDFKGGVCSFNPHCGEGGFIGDEETRIINALKKSKIKQFGSKIYAADTLFYLIKKKYFNTAVCMYHDQGLIPFKMSNFDSGVNITYGLDIIRTSPDHGTAFDIAGKGVASEKSFIQAVAVADLLIKNKQ